VDGDEARAVIAKLRRRGFSRRAISEGTGLSYRTLRAIESGESHSVRQDTIAELRAFCSPPKGSTALVSAARTHDLVARLERTMTRGQMAARLGIPRASIPASTQRRVQYRTQERIEALARAEGLLKERVDTERLRILLDEGCGVELAAEIIGTDPRSAYRVLAMAAS
jgi:transcriptional regulator with XRE-family HTH domain